MDVDDKGVEAGVRFGDDDDPDIGGDAVSSWDDDDDDDDVASAEGDEEASGLHIIGLMRRCVRVSSSVARSNTSMMSLRTCDRRW